MGRHKYTSQARSRGRRRAHILLYKLQQSRQPVPFLTTQVLEKAVADGLTPNEYSLVMVLQAANFKRKGRHKVGAEEGRGGVVGAQSMHAAFNTHRPVCNGSLTAACQAWHVCTRIHTYACNMHACATHTHIHTHTHRRLCVPLSACPGTSPCHEKWWMGC